MREASYARKKLKGGASETDARSVFASAKRPSLLQRVQLLWWTLEPPFACLDAQLNLSKKFSLNRAPQPPPSILLVWARLTLWQTPKAPIAL